MQQKMHLKKRLNELLQANPEQKFTTLQLAHWFWKTYPEACTYKMATTRCKTKNALIRQIRSEIGRDLLELQNIDPHFQSINGDISEWYFSAIIGKREMPAAQWPLTTNEANEPPESPPDSATHYLYQFLWEYLVDRLLVYSKRIDARKTIKVSGPKNYQWRYPDFVGLEDLGDEPAIAKINRKSGGKKARLWAFDVRQELNAANYHEAFLHAANVSAWANFGYLVTSKINGEDTIQELQMLADQHGVGVILLDRDYPRQKSELLIPAHEKPKMDWKNIQRLARANIDFRKFIRLVTLLQTGADIDIKQWLPSTW